MEIQEAIKRSEKLENEFDELMTRIVKDWYKENKLDRNKRDLFLEYVQINFHYESETNEDLIKEVYANLILHSDLLKAVFEYKRTQTFDEFIDSDSIINEISKEIFGSEEIPSPEEIIDAVNEIVNKYPYKGDAVIALAEWLETNGLTLYFGDITVSIDVVENKNYVLFENDDFVNYLGK